MGVQSEYNRKRLIQTIHGGETMQQRAGRLTDRQRKFAELYLQLGNASEAAVQAGFKRSYAQAAKRQPAGAAGFAAGAGAAAAGAAATAGASEPESSSTCTSYAVPFTVILRFFMFDFPFISVMFQWNG